MSPATNGGAPARGFALVGVALGALVSAPAAAQKVHPAPPSGAPAPRVQQPRAPGDTIPSRQRQRPGADTARASRPAAPQEADSVYDQLRKLQGYTPVEYRGKTAEYHTDERVLHLRGDAEVQRAGQTLTADSIVYAEPTKIASAYGNPKVSGEGQNIEGDVLVYDLENRKASVLGGRTQYSSGVTWYVKGQTVAAEQRTDRIYAENSTFTSDERPEPQYHFEAGKVMVIKDRLLVGRPAVLYFRNVPVAWLPFIVQDMEKGRRSGILTPRFGINDIVRTNTGYQRQISNLGYYWAINEYMGAQVDGEWRSNSYTSLQGTMDYNWKRQFLNGSASWREYFPQDGAHQRTLAGNTRWRPNERTDLAADASYASSSSYVRRRSIDPFEATQDLRSNLSLNRRFDWGQVSLGAQRRQSLGNDRVETVFPSFGFSPNSITLFRSPTPELSSWYSNTTLTFNASGSRSSTKLPSNVVVTNGQTTVGQRNESLGNLQVSQSLTMGKLSFNNSASLNRRALEGVKGIDSVTVFNQDEGQWSSSISYQQNLIGSTFIAPNLSLSQAIRRDTLGGNDKYIQGPLRTNFGASVNTDLYGFFPGVGGIQAIRHHIKPGINYTYSPQVQQNELQKRVFGEAGGRTQNVVSLSLDQTFEAKMRSPNTPATPARAAAGGPGAPGTPGTGGAAGSGADSAAAAAPAAPVDARKVTLLALTTSAIGYDFAAAQAGESGWVGSQITNTIRSDYLQGLNLTVTHDLFEPPPPDSKPGVKGKFAPQLSSVSTSFSFGQGSALFRFLGLGQRDRNGNASGPSSMTPGQGMVPGDTAALPSGPVGPTTATANPIRAGGGGPWQVRVDYSLIRPRQTLNYSTGTGTSLPASSFYGLRNESTQTLNGTLSFSPTPNWAVNWNTSYSITDGQFGAHRLSLVRDLYRWQANFDFYRTPVGNTSFQFSVHLKDLPDLKLDYNERDIGVDQR
ncbi:MAG: LPS-assembly protein LptD [Gemmatimonadetes bacterium]|nr:LPS-assembly protein LptD [Gemmatimonadota bacterium]